MSFADALRKVINHEANQDVDGGFFAKFGGLEPDPDDDGPTAKGLFQHMTRDNDKNRADCHTPWENRHNKLPPGLHYFRDILSPPGPFMRILKRKRRPIVKVRRNDIPIGGDVLTIKSWEWECHICKQTWWSLNWWTTQNSATRHAHNHHGGQVK